MKLSVPLSFRALFALALGSSSVACKSDDSAPARVEPAERPVRALELEPSAPAAAPGPSPSASDAGASSAPAPPPAPAAHACSGEPSPTRQYRVAERAASGFALHVRDQTETVVERGEIGERCVERLLITSPGRAAAHALRVLEGNASWTLGRLRQPLAKTSAEAIEKELSLLRHTDVLFTPGARWGYTYSRAFHGSPMELPSSLRAEVKLVQNVGQRDFSYVSYSDALYGGEVWIREASRVWFARVSTQPDFTLARERQDMHWLPRPHEPPHFDVEAARLRAACSSAVCLPAWASARGKATEVAFLPGAVPLRITERDYSEETGDGGTLHLLLQSLPAPSTASVDARSALPAARVESAELRAKRESLAAALEARGLKGLTHAAGRDFRVATFDEAPPAEKAINQDWTEPHHACALAQLRALLSRPCVELGATLGVCTEPPLDAHAWTLGAALASSASATFQKEGARWRLASYLDRLALVTDSEAALDRCELR